MDSEVELERCCPVAMAAQSTPDPCRHPATEKFCGKPWAAIEEDQVKPGELTGVADFDAGLDAAASSAQDAGQAVGETGGPPHYTRPAVSVGDRAEHQRDRR